jgi:hypothetical protein
MKSSAPPISPGPRWLALLLILVIAPPASADEWWAWSMLEFYRQPPWSAGLFLGNRADDQDGFHTQIASPRLKYDALPWLDVGLGLSALSLQHPASGIRYSQCRPELEIDPHFQLARQLRLDWRNRLEWRHNDDPTFPAHDRTRHRLQLGWTLPRPLGPLTRLFASNEWLIDLHQRQWTENRLIPLGLTFKLSPKTDLDCFYLLLQTKPQDTWNQESVLGTYLRVRF